MLNQKGYKLAVDGSFGPKTQKALIDYQTKNNLTYDGSGVAGDETWSHLYGTAWTRPKTTQETLTEYENNKPSYTESDVLKQAAQQLSEYEQKKPGEYQSQYGDQIQAILNNILNRKDFSYDFSADPLYQQYKNQFQQQGRLAMMDTMGQAAALTGGYGSSYGQTAGQQIYNQNLAQVNNIIPELQQAAIQAYENQGNKMQQNLANLQGMDESAYARHQNDVADYYNELNYLTNKTNTMSQEEYNKYVNDLSAWQKDRDYWFGKAQAEQDQANWEKQFKAATAKKSGGGGGKGSSHSKAYSAVASRAKSMSQSSAKAYLERMVDGGYITGDEAAYIYSVILGY